MKKRLTDRWGVGPVCIAARQSHDEDLAELANVHDEKRRKTKHEVSVWPASPLAAEKKVVSRVSGSKRRPHSAETECMHQAVKRRRKERKKQRR